LRARRTVEKTAVSRASMQVEMTAMQMVGQRVDTKDSSTAEHWGALTVARKAARTAASMACPLAALRVDQ
jgi:hypothetical protein